MVQSSQSAFQGQGELVPSAVKRTARVGVQSMLAIGVLLVVFTAMGCLRGRLSPTVREVAAQLLSLALLVFVGWYVRALGRAFQVHPRGVSIHADARGLFLDGTLVAPRAAVRLAVIRRHREASSTPTPADLPLELAAAPETVEIVTGDDSWDLAVDGPHRGAALLAAMGFPATTVPADFVRAPTRAEQNAMRPFKVAIATVVALAMLSGPAANLLAR